MSLMPGAVQRLVAETPRAQPRLFDRP